MLTDIPAVIAADLRVDVGAAGEERPPRARTLTPTPPPSAVTGSEGHEVQSIDVTAGTRIGQYEIIRELGRGGMGTVYPRARHCGSAAASRSSSCSRRSPELTQRFLVEARATARCSHENIVVIYEVGEHQGSPYMVLEYLQRASR